MRKLQNSDDSGSPRTAITREIQVSELIKDGREVVLVHRGERYRLRVTASGKLLLTK